MGGLSYAEISKILSDSAVMGCVIVPLRVFPDIETLG
jgi:hypothetical protein